MITLIDHRDSFSHNLAHLLEAEGQQLHWKDAHALTPVAWHETDLLVISPGPGCPADYPDVSDLYLQARDHVPVLGVCLGFQTMLEVEGARMERMPRVMHGEQTEICPSADTIAFDGLTSPLKVGRYHSLRIDQGSLPSSIRLTALDARDHTPLAFEDPERLLFGFQFHPDSFLTPCGPILIQNILRKCLERRR